MSIWSKLVTALKGNANQLGEAVVDSQAMVILDQEIRDTDNELREAKSALAEIMAKHKVAKDHIASLQKQATEYEGYALKALEKDEQTLASEVAEKIARLENEISSQQAVVDNYATSVADLRKSVQQAEGNLKRLRQQADTVRATESVQKAQASVASRHSGSNAKLQTAMDSLERIKQKQAERGARMEAARELEQEANGDQLADKLKAAGIAGDNHSAQAVLDRLKKKQSS